MKYFTHPDMPDVQIEVPDESADYHYERTGWVRVDTDQPTTTVPDASSPAPGADGGSQTAAVDLSKNTEPAGGEPDPSAEQPVPGHAEGDPA